MSELESTPGTELESTPSNEVATTQKGLTSAKVTQALGRIWNNSHLWRVTTLLLILAVGLQALLGLLIIKM